MKKIFSLTIISLLFLPNLLSQEFLLHEETFTWTKDADVCGGYHYWYDLGEAPSSNWKVPYDYQNGTYYFRFEVISQPTSEPFKLNMCIWTEYLNGVWKEECMGFSPTLAGNGSTVTYSSPVTYQKDGIHIDWTDLTKLWRMGNPIFVNNHNLGPSIYCSDNPEEWAHVDSYFPLRLRITIVAVASGYSFSGWSNYTGVTPPPSKQPTPTYGIEYGNERTNKVVPSTDEYSTSSNMAGAISGNGQKLALVPGQGVYFRTKAGNGLLESDIQHLAVSDRPAAPSYTIDYINEKTVENVASGISYSTSTYGTNPVNGSGNKVTLVPGQDLYFWKAATSGAFASPDFHLAVPSRPASPSINLNYSAEITSNISSSMEYSANSLLSPATSGSNAGVAVTPGTDLYIRYKANSGVFSSLVQTLDVPYRPQTPSFDVDYIFETTTSVVSSAFEYAISPDMNGAVVGNGSKLAIIPGTSLYFRQSASSGSFKSLVQTLVVPVRPTKPLFTLDYINETTAETVDLGIAYSTSSSYTDPINGTGNTLAVIPGQDIYFWKKATSESFESDITHLIVPGRPATPTFVIDFMEEAIDESVTAEFEFGSVPDLADAVAGIGNPVTVIPENTLYFRKLATSAGFRSLIQTLIIPARPSAPLFNIHYVNESTMESVTSDIETSLFSDMSVSQPGTGSALLLDPGTDYYFRLKYSPSSFTSEVFHLEVPEKPVISSAVGDTTEDDFFLATVDFQADPAGFDISDVQAENASVSLVESGTIRVEPETHGQVSLYISANAIIAGNFTSDILMTYYKKIISSVSDPGASEASMSVYPSPFVDLLHIQISEKMVLPVQISVMNVSGIVLFRQKAYSTRETLNLDDLSSGIYVLKVIDAEGNMVTRKIIRQ